MRRGGGGHPTPSRAGRGAGRPPGAARVLPEGLEGTCPHLPFFSDFSPLKSASHVIFWKPRRNDGEKDQN